METNSILLAVWPIVSLILFIIFLRWIIKIVANVLAKK